MRETREYEPQQVENQGQRFWDESHAFDTPADGHSGVPVLIYAAAPFTSGDIHIGHVRSYVIADTYARFTRSRGDAVLFSMGFDAFGLPVELAAQERGEAPTQWVEHCRTRMTRQLQRLGLSTDWRRTFVSSDPGMYRWSQWLFLMLLDADLVYRSTQPIDFCPQCETVLARLQVQDGKCWRCQSTVRSDRRPQWFLKVTAYREENEVCLDQLDYWSPLARSAQKSILGRIDGVEVQVATSLGRRVSAFTPYGDALSEAKFAAISPRYPDAGDWLQDPGQNEQLDELRAQGLGGWDGGSGGASIPFIETGHTVSLPGGPNDLPVIISPATDARFGTTLALGIPSRDRTDAAIAHRLIGQSLRSSAADGEPSAGLAKKATRYRLQDFVISRQRAWGAPIPIVHCAGCGIVPVPLDSLPVELPPIEYHAGEGNPLRNCPDFLNTACPSCQQPATREPDTLDCHLDALWMEMPSCVPAADRAHSMFDHPEVRRWLPGGLLVWGADGGGYMFDMRMITKALRDMGPLRHLPEGEPFRQVIMHEMVQQDGQKMSKSAGNTVTPMELIEEVGADSLRFAVLYAAAPRKALKWTDDLISHAEDFLAEVWKFALPRLEEAEGVDPEKGIDSEDPLRAKLVRRCETAVKKITRALDCVEPQKATRDLVHLFDRIVEFETTVRNTRNKLTPEDAEAVQVALLLFVRLLQPVAPHIAEELWHLSGQDSAVATYRWPASPYQSTQVEDRAYGAAVGEAA